MSARRYTLPLLTLATTLALAVTGCSSSDDKIGKADRAGVAGRAGTPKPDSVDVVRDGNPSGSPGGEHSGEHGRAAPASGQTGTGAAEPASGDEVFFAAGLSGANEVPATDGK